MSIFVIFRVAKPDALRAKLQSRFPNDHLEIDAKTWLVSAEGTAKSLSDQLEVSDGQTGSAIIFKMANYFGRAPTDIWEWVASKAEKSDG